MTAVLKVWEALDENWRHWEGPKIRPYPGTGALGPGSIPPHTFFRVAKMTQDHTRGFSRVYLCW
jgi:hypothetical protein